MPVQVWEGRGQEEVMELSLPLPSADSVLNALLSNNGLVLVQSQFVSQGSFSPDFIDNVVQDKMSSYRLSIIWPSL